MAKTTECSKVQVFIGTKAQLIKMMPVMHELERRGVRYNLIDAGQHGGLTDHLIQEFGIQKPVISLRNQRTNISSIPQALFWTLQNFFRLLRQRSTLTKWIFQKETGICLIHGDTLTTLISLLYAKRCGLKVAHIEAGLRSYRIFDPFPEEIIRLIAMRYSDILFAPSDTAYSNLCQMGYDHKSVNVGANTGVDAVKYILKRHTDQMHSEKDYILVSMHRMETIYSNKRLNFIVRLIKEMARKQRVLFILHDPTRRQLIKLGLLEKLQSDSIELSPIIPYAKFIRIIANAKFVVTDGGSIQEECSYLNKPCMILRMNTERNEGVGKNAVLTRFSQDAIDYFFQIFPLFQVNETLQEMRPSEAIVNHLTSLM